MKSLQLSQRSAFLNVATLEIFERFSYYAVAALITIFAVKMLGYSDEASTILFTGFSALLYATPPVGGMIADKLLGSKRAMLVGAILLLVGYVLLALTGILHMGIMLPLAIVIGGNMLFKSQAATLIGSVAEGSSHDASFTIYYMAVNIGSLFATLFGPILANHYGFNAVFALAAAGLFLSLGNFLIFAKAIHQYGSEKDKVFPGIDKILLCAFIIVAVVALSLFLLNHVNILESVVYIVCGLFILFFILKIFRESNNNRKAMSLIVVLFIGITAFFIVYFQMGGALTTYALRNVQHNVFGIPLPAASFQGINPIVILLASPLLALIYGRKHSGDGDVSIIIKIATGLILSAIACLVVPLGNFFAIKGIVNSNYLVLLYVIQSVAELLVSALSLAVAYKYSPSAYKNYTMGIMLLAPSLGAALSAEFAKFIATPNNSVNPLVTLPLYGHMFTALAVTVGAVGLLLFAFYPVLKKLQVQPS